jgi:phenylacetate-coenzyme A ligase PaaK-like adenylate-forming protein
MIHIEDYQREHLKDLVYLQEEQELFYRSLNHSEEAQIEVFQLKDIKSLQDIAKLNESIPASIIVKADIRLNQNYERKINALSFQRTS